MLAAVLVACGDAGRERGGADAAPVVDSRLGVRLVHNTSPAEGITPRRGLPSRARLLFAGVAPAAHRSDGTQAVIAPDGARILEFDRSGRFVRSLGDTSLVKAVGVSAGADGWLVTEREGRVLSLASDGSVTAGFEVPFGSAVVAPFMDGLIAARSPFAISTAPVSFRAPLLIETTLSGQIRASFDTVVSNLDPQSAFLMNAGLVAARDSMIIFAFFTRDEIRAYDNRGRLRWVSDRSMQWPRPPGVQASPSGPTLRFSAVNLGVAMDEENVLVLSYADSTEASVRLDVLDLETGVLAKSFRVERGPWLISRDDRKSFWIAPVDTLASLATPRARSSFPTFHLATLDGGTFDLASTRGRVTLVNFWASWCPPCREEFPLMNRLARELRDQPFTIVAVNEDVSESAARKFLEDTPATFAIPMGGGKMQARVGYRGLPFTVLLDRDGRIIERFFGFGGPTQFALLRRRIDRALAEAR